jgi:hypothetical protein
MERSMRKYIKKTGNTLQGWDRKETDRPTSFMMGTKFFGVMVTKIDNHRMLTNKLTPTQQSYLLHKPYPICFHLSKTRIAYCKKKYTKDI